MVEDIINDKELMEEFRDLKALLKSYAIRHKKDEVAFEDMSDDDILKMSDKEVLRHIFGYAESVLLD